MPSQPPAKKPRLTLGQLTSYDDVLTDALVDKTYYWTTIRKNKSAYHPSRGVREEDVTDIIQKYVIVEQDAATAERQLLALSGLKKFSESLKTDKEKDDFRKHLRRYVNIYLPDCPFEVSSTNRYTVVTHEAAVTARMFIKKGEVVKYLSGIQVIMTEEEEESIKHSRRDFSIVISSRKGSASLFLGPARFANHDCGANARLQTAGKDGMEIYAIRDIDIDDEITVTYGDDYFGEDNCECLCKTCEDLCQNGWTAPDDDENQGTPTISIEEPTGYSFRRRRYESTPMSRDQSETPEVNIRPKVSKTPRSTSRFKNVEPSPSPSPPIEPSLTPLGKRKRELDLPSPSPAPKKTKKFAAQQQQIDFVLPTTESAINSPTTSRSESAQLSPAPSSNNGTTDATSVDEDTIIVQPAINPIISKLRRTRGNRFPDSLEQAEAGATILVGKSTSITHPALQDDASSILSDLPSELELDEVAMSVAFKAESPPPKRKRGRPSNASLGKAPATPKSNSKPKSKPISKSVPSKRVRKFPTPKTDRDHAPSVRIPGDYVLTSALLAEPASSWICCKICEAPFVQKDAYFTRSSCPRCERHSKLYGYMWPKTDWEEGDTEERVLDHRTVHRFIKPKEEKDSRKRAREETRDVSEVVEEVGRRKRSKRSTL